MGVVVSVDVSFSVAILGRQLMDRGGMGSLEVVVSISSRGG
jgi:hypothetical protein